MFLCAQQVPMKVLNIFICDQGAYSSTIGLAVAGWVLRVLGVVPRQWETGHFHRIGRFASLASILPSGKPLHCCMLYRTSRFVW